jgi:hypothetical protein
MQTFWFETRRAPVAGWQSLAIHAGTGMQGRVNRLEPPEPISARRQAIMIGTAVGLAAGVIVRSFTQRSGMMPRAVLRGQGDTWPLAFLVIDVATGQRLGLLAPAIHPFFSPDGRMLAVRDSSLAIELFDVPATASGNSR